MNDSSDPYYIITIETEDGKQVFKDKSEVQEKTLQPVWKKLYRLPVDESFKGARLWYTFCILVSTCSRYIFPHIYISIYIYFHIYIFPYIYIYIFPRIYISTNISIYIFPYYV